VVASVPPNKISPEAGGEVTLRDEFYYFVEL
jgi:hypothetical protein